MALHEPPVPCDHTMSKASQERVATKMRERAAAAAPALDGQAVRRAAAVSPAEAARLVLDHAEAQARAALVGRPSGSTYAAAMAQPRIAEAITRRDAAREDAKEAIQAAAAHRSSHPWTSRILDGASRRRQAALDAEAMRLDREARQLDRGHERSVKRIERDAEREAKANRTAFEDWQWSKPVRQAEVQIGRIDRVRTAVASGDTEALGAVGRGDIMGAAAGVERRATVQAAEAQSERREKEQRERAVSVEAAAEMVAAAFNRRAEEAQRRQREERRGPTEPQSPGPAPRL
jgi:hypothetical protein